MFGRVSFHYDSSKTLPTNCGSHVIRPNLALFELKAEAASTTLPFKRKVKFKVTAIAQGSTYRKVLEYFKGKRKANKLAMLSENMHTTKARAMITTIMEKKQ